MAPSWPGCRELQDAHVLVRWSRTIKRETRHGTMVTTGTGNLNWLATTVVCSIASFSLDAAAPSGPAFNEGVDPGALSGPPRCHLLHSESTVTERPAGGPSKFQPASGVTVRGGCCPDSLAGESRGLKLISLTAVPSGGCGPQRRTRRRPGLSVVRFAATISDCQCQ
jgi:hypothetical protein